MNSWILMISWFLKDDDKTRYPLQVGVSNRTLINYFYDYHCLDRALEHKPQKELGL